MNQIVDSVECGALHRSIVRPEALKKAVLVQDVGTPGHLFALLMIDNSRAVQLTQGKLDLNARAGVGMQKLQAFRNQLYRTSVSSYELRFCEPQTSDRLTSGERFDPQWFVEASFPELLTHIGVWRAGQATR